MNSNTVREGTIQMVLLCAAGNPLLGPQERGSSKKAPMAPSAFAGISEDTFANMTAVATTVVEEWQPRTVPPVLPATPVVKKELFRYINEQLDCFGKHNGLLGRYQLLGPNERRNGGVFYASCLQNSTVQKCVAWAGIR